MEIVETAGTLANVKSFNIGNSGYPEGPWSVPEEEAETMAITFLSAMSEYNSSIEIIASTTN